MRSMMADQISPGLQKLLGEPAFCQLATLMPDGSPQITQVWVSTDGEHSLVNTYEGAQKLRNVRPIRGSRSTSLIQGTPGVWQTFADALWMSPPREPIVTST